MKMSRLASFSTLSALALAACGPNQEHIRADSTAAVAAAEQTQLATQLAAQKDSLTRVVLQADDFISRIDSSMSRVRGLPKGKRSDKTLDPLARQVENRRVVMERVDALVKRAQTTAAQLAKANKSNKALLAQIAADSAMIADLNATIQRQTLEIAGLSSRIDSLKTAGEQLASTLANVETDNAKVYYVVGREDELVKRGVIVREGGANLLLAHPGRTLQIARTIPTDAFTTVDSREIKVIPMPDSTRHYRIVSRQSLDNADVQERKKNTFRGNLKIADATRFWAPSKYLVVVEQ
ncbi:MAG TPA: hypothetical protein VL328_08295 [Gemmatimonadaceae bacterium]|jgi:hypothetical protein|nr:hypothetical protein [Gemmatimonadaceae bacterium]